MQIYHLLSVYRILKPPKFGNCKDHDLLIENQPKLTFEDFKNAFDGSKSKSFKKEQLKLLEEKLEKYVEKGDWDLGDLMDDVTPEMDPDIFKSVIFYIVGFICSRMYKKSGKCQECQKAFESDKTMAVFPVAEFCDIKDRGKLVYPKKYIFETFLKIENIFLAKLDTENILEAVTEEVLKQGIHMKFPCDTHKAEKFAECIHYYILVRLKQSVKLINRNSSSKLSNIKNKEANATLWYSKS